MLAKLMFKTNKLLVIISFICMFIYSFNGVLIASIIYYAGQFNRSTSIRQVVIFGLIAITAWMIVYLAEYSMALSQSKIIQKTNVILKNRFLSNIWFSQSLTNAANVISALMNDFKLLESNYYFELFSLAENVCILIVSLLYMLSLNLTISLIFIFFSLLPLVTPILFSKSLQESAEKWTVKNDTVTFLIKDFFIGFYTFKTYNKENRIFKLMSSKIQELEQSFFSLSKVQREAELMGSLAAGISFIFPFVVGCIISVIQKNFSFATLLALFLANDRVVGPVTDIVSSLNKIKSTKLVRQKILSTICHTKERVRDKETKHRIFKDTDYNFSFKAHNIQYQINSSQAITFNLDISPKDKILIYGQTGTGKSTLLKLLNGSIIKSSGFYFEEDSLGHKLFDPYDEVAYINQTPVIFSSNLLDNITLFDSNVQNDYVHRILQKTGLDKDFHNIDISKILAGENGNKISGGQKQKIEVARALYAGRKLILADEVTANLDRKNAANIRNILFNLPQPVIEVAHHYNLADKRYTKIYELGNSGNLRMVKNEN